LPATAPTAVNGVAMVPTATPAATVAAPPTLAPLGTVRPPNDAAAAAAAAATTSGAPLARGAALDAHAGPTNAASTAAGASSTNSPDTHPDAPGLEPTVEGDSGERPHTPATGLPETPSNRTAVHPATDVSPAAEHASLHGGDTPDTADTTDTPMHDGDADSAAATDAAAEPLPTPGSATDRIDATRPPLADQRSAGAADLHPRSIEPTHDQRSATVPTRAAPDDVARPSQLLPLTTHHAKHITVAVEHDQLGAIRIGATDDRGTINISLQADGAAATSVLRDHAAQLSDHLAHSGVTVGHVEVRHGDGMPHRHARPMPFVPESSDGAANPGTDHHTPDPTRTIHPVGDTDRRVDLLL
jgi:hypothetical protein